MQFQGRGEKLEPQAEWPWSWWRSPWRIRFSPRIEYCSPQDRELLSEPSHIANRLIEKKFEFGVSAFSCPLRSSGRGPLSKSQHTGTILILRGNWDYPPLSYCALVVNSQYKKRLPSEPTLLYRKEFSLVWANWIWTRLRHDGAGVVLYSDYFPVIYTSG